MKDERGIELFGKNYHTVGLKANTYLGDEGVYTLITGKGIEIKVEMEEFGKDNYKEVFVEHVRKVNDITDKFSAAEVIMKDDFLADVVYQSMAYMGRTKEAVKQWELGREIRNIFE